MSAVMQAQNVDINHRPEPDQVIVMEQDWGESLFPICPRVVRLLVFHEMLKATEEHHSRIYKETSPFWYTVTASSVTCQDDRLKGRQSLESRYATGWRQHPRPRSQCVHPYKG